MVDFQRIEKLKQEYSDKFVVVDAARPELARFKDVTGRVKTVNMSGRALVEFDAGDNNIGWYDIELDFLKIIDKPLPKKTPEPAKPAAKKAPAKPAASGAAKAKGKSTADILAAARGGAKPAAKSEKTDSPAGKKKLSTADILAAARGKESATEAASQPDASKDEKKPLSTADILAAARGGAKPSAASTVVEEEPVAEPPADEALEVEEAPAVEEPVAVEEPAAEESAVADESPAEVADDSASVSNGDFPSDVEGIIAWCREHDGG